jgi:hypothetical protein
VGRAVSQPNDPLRIATRNAMPAPTPKPPSKKICHMCGRQMFLERDQDDPRRTIYACSNKACEREERAA